MPSISATTTEQFIQFTLFISFHRLPCHACTNSICLSERKKEGAINEKRGGCNKLKRRLVCVMFGCQGITRWTGNITWVTSSQTQNTHSKTLTFTLKHKRTASILNFKQASIGLNMSIILRSYEVKIVVILPSLTKLICNLEAVQMSMARSSHTWCVFVWT